VSVGAAVPVAEPGAPRVLRRELDATRWRWPLRWLRGLLARLELGAEGVLGQVPVGREVVARANLRRLRRAWRIESERERASPSWLRAAERRVYSQNGEDGILAGLFERIGVTNRFFVEIGASDGSENCTRLLAEGGWSGVWLEADPSRVLRARRIAGPDVRVVTAAARRETIVGVLEQANVPARPDLLVVDIDGNDFWILDALLRSFAPRILVAEYNAVFWPSQWWTCPYRAEAVWDGTFRHGASLLALAQLARRAGLALVGCDSAGVNAFFVQADEVERAGVHQPGSVAGHYVGPWYSSGLWGHLRSRRARLPMLALADGELRRIVLRKVAFTHSRRAAAAGEPLGVRVTVENGSTARLSSGEPAPVHLVLAWQDGGSAAWERARRILLPYPIPPRCVREVTTWVPAPLVAGRHVLIATAVQEGVAWLHHLEPGAVARAELEVSDGRGVVARGGGGRV